MSARMFNGRPLVNLGNAVLATPETAAALIEDSAVRKIHEAFVAYEQRNGLAGDPNYPCYACGEPSTHGVRCRSAITPSGWVCLNVCDSPSCNVQG